MAANEIFGIYRSSSVFKVEPIEDEQVNHKKYSNVVEIENGPSRNGNGKYYVKIFTQGEFKNITSGNWTINPFVTIRYDWTDEWAAMDVIDINQKEYTCRFKSDYRTIFKRNGDSTVSIQSVFRFINTLKEYLNLEQYLLNESIGKSIDEANDRWSAKYDELSREEFVEFTLELKEIDLKLDEFKGNSTNIHDKMNEKMSELRDKFNNCKIIDESETE